MTGKVRRVDWSPDEYMGGTFGNLTVDEHGAYIIALNLIYSSGGPIFVDLGRFAHAGRSRPQRMRAERGNPVGVRPSGGR